MHKCRSFFIFKTKSGTRVGMYVFGYGVEDNQIMKRITSWRILNSVIGRLLGRFLQ